MNQRIKDKIQRYQQGAGNGQHVSTSGGADGRNRERDGLANVIRTKKDADQFTTELNGIARAKK